MLYGFKFIESLNIPPSEVLIVNKPEDESKLIESIDATAISPMLSIWPSLFVLITGIRIDEPNVPESAPVESNWVVIFNILSSLTALVDKPLPPINFTCSSSCNWTESIKPSSVINASSLTFVTCWST